MGFDNEWENFYYSGGGNNYPDPILVSFIMRSFPKSLDRSKIKILDLGCGLGGNTWFLCREGFSTYGIDGSESAINKLKKKLKNFSSNLNLFKGDINNLSYNDNNFDAIIDCAPIQHNDNQNSIKILTEVERVIKPKSKIFSIMINKHKNLSESNYYTRFVTKNNIKTYFKKFELISIDKSCYTEENESKSINFFVILAEKKG
tara:strand:- start:132 stop:740 length:609 start_codon:yes stop_codon:yes gene_type:complete